MITNRQYELMKEQTDVFAQKYGPAAVLVAVLAYYNDNGLSAQALVLERACSEIGVKFKKKNVPSMTEWGEEYTITLMPDDKHTCSCKGWIFCKIPNRYFNHKKWCKHLESYADDPSGWESMVDLKSLPSAEEMNALATAAAGAVAAPGRRVFRTMD
jgi:hypothetical protein